MELAKNQAALILTEGDGGEITVDIASSNIHGLAGAICQAIAKKMIEDELFYDDLRDIIVGDTYE